MTDREATLFCPDCQALVVAQVPLATAARAGTYKAWHWVADGPNTQRCHAWTEVVPVLATTTAGEA